jgi:quercetin dioxygenase-like cupin family protein
MLSRRLTGRVYPISIPLRPDEEKGWKPYPAFNGFTAGLQNLFCHVSVLNKDHSPHKPHSHNEEEILLLLHGEVELILPEVQPHNTNQRIHLKTGEFVYYPAHFAHTLQTVSEEPANYLMFKWQNHTRDETSPLAFGRFSMIDSSKDIDVEEGFRTRLVFQGSTAYLRKLHCHTSTLTPGSGYDFHIDAYDVAIIVMEGEVETLGERAGPHSVIFYPAGEPHGMHNPGDKVAKYVVFEFHSTKKGLTGARLKSLISLLAKAKDPRRWKRKLTKWFAYHKK